MASQSNIPWFSDIVGVAYRYFDLRMNVVPLFGDRKMASNIWHDTVHWWLDPSIKIRFVEDDENYWFIMGSASQHPESNLSFFKILPISENYHRFKKGHDGEAYLRFGVYSKKFLKDVKKDAVCNCGHIAEDHDKNDKDLCLYEECTCPKFSSFQINLLKRKKVITDIAFLTEDNIKDDPLSWNCIYVNKISKIG